MNQKNITDETIESVAEEINRKTSQQTNISIATVEENATTPHYYEIIQFDKIDEFQNKCFAIDGSYNSQEFYNGIHVGLYTAGYVCYCEGKQVRMNTSDDPVFLGKSYFPENILITNEQHKQAIYDELLEIKPVKKMVQFFGCHDVKNIWALDPELMFSSVSKLLSFCQEVLEWSLILEILESPHSSMGDFILRDGTLRSVNILQEYLVKLGQYAKEKGIFIVAVTKTSPIKLELSSSFKKIDLHLEKDKKPSYPFNIKTERWQKLCCWFEVPDDVLLDAYPDASSRKKQQGAHGTVVKRYSMYANSSLKGGRGFGLFFAARLDYVEKLQNYDWVVVDLNVFDAIPDINEKMKEPDVRKTVRNITLISQIFKELTRFTQEHYILGYPYPLVEAHNFVTLKKSFKDDIINRVKASLYHSQKMDHVDIENMFLDIHQRF